MFQEMNLKKIRILKTQLTRVTMIPLLIMSFLFIVSCSKTDEILDGSCAKTSEESQLCLKITDSSGASIRNIDRNDTATIVATLETKSGSAISGVVVQFETTLSSLDPDTGTSLTGDNGQATITLNEGGDIGAGTVTASAEIGGETLTVTYGFAIGGTVVDTTEPEPDPEPEPDTGAVSNSVSGSIEFVDATPSTIALRGTGGAGLSEFSTVTFRVIGTDGLPKLNQNVTFSLNSDIGGINLDPRSALTNSEGIVSTTVQAGSVPTSIRVTATTKIINTSNVEQDVSTPSDKLAVSTGIPDQNSLSLALSVLNPEAANIDGEEVDVTARVADHFNNWVPDGTTVYFTTEGGSIEPSCQTENGACSVKWISQDPRPSDHRVTILATTLGNESFVDTNSDGKYSTVDGEPFTDINGNNVYDEPFTDTNSNLLFDEPFVVQTNNTYDPPLVYTDSNRNGKFDLAEPFDDLDADGVHDGGESYTDINGNGSFDAAETFTDADGDNKYDFGEAFVDSNGNGFFDSGDQFKDEDNDGTMDGEPYVDTNNNGQYDVIEPSYSETFTDTDGDGIRDSDEPFVDANNNGIYESGLGESFVNVANGVYDSNEQFIDLGNGEYDIGEPITVDLNGNGVYDAKEVFEDADNDGIFDAGEVYTDANGNGAYDPGDSFTDLGDGKWNEGEFFYDIPNLHWDSNESFTDAADAKYDLTDIFVDYNGDGIYQGAGNNPAGETTFTDSNNGNGLYDGSGTLAAGESYADYNGNSAFDGPGFADLGEPYLDINEDHMRNVDEPYVDSNNNGTFEATGDGQYNGILCISGNNCSSKSMLHISASNVLIMSSSFARGAIFNSFSQDIIYRSTIPYVNTTSGASIDISFGKSISLTAYIEDYAGQVMPAGTVIQVTTSVGKIAGITNFEVSSTRGRSTSLRSSTGNEITLRGGHYINFTIIDTAIDESESGVVTITVTTPRGSITPFTIPFQS